MNLRVKRSLIQPVGFTLSILMAAAVVAVAAPQPNVPSAPQPNPVPTDLLSQASVTNTLKPATPKPALANYSDFKPRPFAVAYETSNFQWTQEDGRDTNVIRQLAHNEGEYRRMIKENETIFRRQLVYHKTGFSALAEKSVQSGQRVEQVTLPGLDGLELPVTMTRTDLRNGGSKGVFYGKLRGDPNSMVTVAFVNGREAFTVISPRNQIYLQAEAREPGEIVVKNINPSTYGRMQP